MYLFLGRKTVTLTKKFLYKALVEFYSPIIEYIFLNRGFVNDEEVSVSNFYIVTRIGQTFPKRYEMFIIQYFLLWIILYPWNFRSLVYSSNCMICKSFLKRILLRQLKLFGLFKMEVCKTYQLIHIFICYQIAIKSNKLLLYHFDSRTFKFVTLKVHYSSYSYYRNIPN